MAYRKPRKMSDKRDPGILRDIIPAVLRSLGLEGRMDEARLVREWRSVVGEGLAARSTPVRILEGILIVDVKDNAWMQEMRFHQKRILGRIEERFPGLGIKGIRLRMERESDEE
jgi:predicted nucleic acid-binding Zn ribbon protein